MFYVLRNNSAPDHTLLFGLIEVVKFIVFILLRGFLPVLGRLNFKVIPSHFIGNGLVRIQSEASC